MVILTTQQQLGYIYGLIARVRAKAYFSPRAKNIKQRFTQSPGTFTKLTNKKLFIEYGEKALNHEGYIHLRLLPPPTNKSNLSKTNTQLICLDIDDFRFGVYLFDLLAYFLKENICDGRLTFYNRTPRGFHFFFFRKKSFKK